MEQPNKPFLFIHLTKGKKLSAKKREHIHAIRSGVIRDPSPDVLCLLQFAMTNGATGASEFYQLPHSTIAPMFTAWNSSTADRLPHSPSFPDNVTVEGCTTSDFPYGFFRRQGFL